MSLIVTGSGIDSAECRELRAKMRERVKQYGDMPATLKFETEDAFIEFQNNGRSVTPYLVLMGRPVSVEGEFPWDVSTVEYASKLDRRLMSYRYEFTRDNLAALAAKGMFEPEFETPDVLRHNLFELPCSVSCVAVGPASEADFPVVFVSLNPGSLLCDDEMSGYVIDEYFEELPQREPDDLVYESAVARTRPYERALNTFSKKLQVPEVENSLAQDGANADLDVNSDSREMPDTAPRGSVGPAERDLDVAEDHELDIISKPVRATPAASETKIDRQAEIDKMGGPDSDDTPHDDRFLWFDDTEFE